MTQKAEKFKELVDKFLEDLKLLNEVFPEDVKDYNIFMTAQVNRGDGHTEHKSIINGTGLDITAALLATIDSNPDTGVMMAKAVAAYPKVAMTKAILSGDVDALERAKKNIKKISENL